jgi:hypothetical protein
MSSSSELTSVTLTNDVRSLLPGAGTVLPPEIIHIHKLCRKLFFQTFFLNLFKKLCFFLGVISLVTDKLLLVLVKAT